MAKLIIRDLDPETVAELRLRAANHGRSVEEEAEEILRSALATNPIPPEGNLADRIRRRFAPLGGIDLELPERDAVRKRDAIRKMDVLLTRPLNKDGD